MILARRSFPAISAMVTALLFIMTPGRVHSAANSASAPTANDVVEKGTPAPAPDVEILAPGAAIGLLGKKVVGSSGENMGPVVDVIVGADGTPRAVVIDFGGFLGVGSRKIAVEWSLLHFEFAKQDTPLVLDLSRSEVQSAPEYKGAGGPLQILISPPGAKPAGPDTSR